MKKLLISLFALSYILNITAAPAELQLKRLDNQQVTKTLNKAPQNIIRSQAPLTRADENEGKWFGYCYAPSMYLGGIPGAILEPVMEIPKEQAELWKGAQITSVNIGFGRTNSMVVNVYITKDLNGVPEVLQEARMANENDWNQVVLNSPYTIDGDAFYIGYQAPMALQTDYPVLVDGVFSTFPYGGIYGLFQNTEDDGYYNWGEMFGTPCLRVELNGENMPQYGAMMNTVYMDQYVQKNEPFQVTFSVVNTGLTSIADVDLSCKVNGELVTPSKVFVLGEESSNEGQVDSDNLAYDRIPFGTVGYVVMEGITSSVTGDVPIEVTVNKLVGADGNEAASGLSFKTDVLVVEKLFGKNFLIEEYTGTWCGWCPRGIVGMWYMEHNYGNKGFIGIAVHYGGDDPMVAPTYADLADYYYRTAGYPTCTLNRTGDPFDPNTNNFKAYYDAYYNMPTPAEVSVVAEYDEVTNSLNATATTQFSLDAQGENYSLAFVVTENKVPGIQRNYFSGGKYGETLPGWTEKNEYVAWNYDEVARFISGSGGLKDSFPEEIEALTPYEYTLEMPLETLLSNVTDVQRCTVIVMVLNTVSGEVMNSAKYVINPEAGVDSLVAEPENGVYKAYNLQGVKMLETKDPSEINNLPKGFYVVNGKKVVVK